MNKFHNSRHVSQFTPTFHNSRHVSQFTPTFNEPNAQKQNTMEDTREMQLLALAMRWWFVFTRNDGLDIPTDSTPTSDLIKLTHADFTTEQNIEPRTRVLPRKMMMETLHYSHYKVFNLRFTMNQTFDDSQVSQFTPRFTIHAHFSQFTPRFHNSRHVSQFTPRFTIHAHFQWTKCSKTKYNGRFSVSMGSLYTDDVSLTRFHSRWTRGIRCCVACFSNALMICFYSKWRTWFPHTDSTPTSGLIKLTHADCTTENIEPGTRVLPRKMIMETQLVMWSGIRRTKPLTMQPSLRTYISSCGNSWSDTDDNTTSHN